MYGRSGRIVTTALEIVLVLVSVATATAFLALMVWAARQDGRDQRRYDRLVRRYRRKI
jgi:hypothetical protein